MPDDLMDTFTEVAAEASAEASAEAETVVEEVADNTVPVPDTPPEDPIAEADETEGTPEPATDVADTPVEEVVSFDWQEHASDLVTITRNGEQEQVTLQEAMEGSMRQADYTHKTQEIADLKKAATWAADVQDAFAKDAEGTARAFAQAYGVELASTTKPDVPETDPYQDLDPDVALVMKKLDEQEVRHQSEIAQIKGQTDQMTQQSMMAEVKAEMQGIMKRFDGLEPEQVLQVAAGNNITLESAAYLIMGQQAAATAKAGAANSETAKSAAALQAEAQAKAQKAKKAQAASTGTGSFDVSKVPYGDFDSIGDLFELVANSTS